MPLSKLQQALKAQQSQASIAAAKKKSAENKQAKEASLKHTPKEKKVLKRARQAGRPITDTSTTNDDDDLTVIDPDTMIAEIEDETKEVEQTRKKKGKGKAVNPNQLPVIPFDKTDTILLLGEANFSYSLSLLAAPHQHPAHQILATSYDTERECYLKYPDGEANVKNLREKGVKVEFKVDAGNLEKCKAVGKGRWSKVIFNFPHAGESKSANRGASQCR
jgi:25S rRNA (uracil2634-N3)-methyltransferase